VNAGEKYDSLQQIIKDLGRVVIAYSGGVDSTFLLKVAADTLGEENVIACIAAGPALPKTQYERAVETAKDFGVHIETIGQTELADTKYSANKADRCFHCKSHLFKILKDIAKNKGFGYVLCGSNVDDRKDYRPGSKAVKAFDVRCPLADAELTKQDIRALSRQLNLTTADNPASPCLASRISYGLEITADRLNQIEQAEEFLRKLGFVEFRLRHHGKLARIEVHAEDIEKITAGPVRGKIVDKLRALGFTFVTVDLQGFRSGSLNEMLTDEQKKKNL